jgi:hypothetical protein
MRIIKNHKGFINNNSIKNPIIENKIFKIELLAESDLFFALRIDSKYDF